MWRGIRLEISKFKGKGGGRGENTHEISKQFLGGSVWEGGKGGRIN